MAATHFIEGYQRVIYVGGGVFQSLGHDGTGELLPLHYEMEPIFSLFIRKERRHLEEKNPVQESEGRRIEARLPPTNLLEGLFQDAPVLGGDSETPDVGTIYRQAGGQLKQCPDQVFAGNVPGRPVLDRQKAEAVSQVFHLPAEQAFHDQLFFVIGHV